MGSDSAAPTKIGRARKKVEIKVKLSPTGPSIVFSSFAKNEGEKCSPMDFED